MARTLVDGTPCLSPNKQVPLFMHQDIRPAFRQGSRNSVYPTFPGLSGYNNTHAVGLPARGTHPSLPQELSLVGLRLNFEEQKRINDQLQGFPPLEI